jgi:hypothetical protein
MLATAGGFSTANLMSSVATLKSVPLAMAKCIPAIALSTIVDESRDRPTPNDAARSHLLGSVRASNASI